LYFGRIDAQPFYESVLHNIFSIRLATKQIIGNVVQHWLIESNGLSLVQNDPIFNVTKVSSFDTK
jgi:hypothetical protein